jgi:hypothetical protein
VIDPPRQEENVLRSTLQMGHPLETLARFVQIESYLGLAMPDREE